MKRTMWLLLVFISVLLLTACGASQSAVTPAVEPPAAPTQTAAVPTLAPEASPTAAPVSTEPAAIPVTGETPAKPVLEAQVDSRDGLNLRVGPGLNYRLMGVLFDGQKVRLEGRSTDSSWVVVRLPDGTAGWAYSAYLKSDGQFSALPLAEAAGGPGTGSPVVVEQPNPVPTTQPTLPGKYTLYMTINDNQAVVSMTKMPANSDVTVQLSARGGQSITVATGKADENGAASFSFAMPRFWPDGSRITQTSLLLTASTTDGSATRSASISYDPGE